MRAFLRLALACSFALSAACGSIANKADAGNGGADASSGDGGGNVADAAPDAATFGMVTVHVYIGGKPAANVAVMYHEADGSYIGSMLTDSSGQVVISDMPVGGAVTAPVNPFGTAASSGETYLTSVTGVQVGDDITIGHSTPGGRDTSSVGLVVENMPGAFAGATSYVVEAGCGTATSTTAGTVLRTTLQKSCVPASNTVDVVAYALDASGNRLAYSAAASVALTGTQPNLSGSITMPAWQSDLGTYTIGLSNSPIDATVLGFFRGFKQDVLVEIDNADAGAATTGNGASFPFLVPPGFFAETTAGAIAQLAPSTASTVAKRSTASPTASNPEQVSWDLFNRLPATPNRPRGNCGCHDDRFLDGRHDELRRQCSTRCADL